MFFFLRVLKISFFTTKIETMTSVEKDNVRVNLGVGEEGSVSQRKSVREEESIRVIELSVEPVPRFLPLPASLCRRK